MGYFKMNELIEITLWCVVSLLLFHAGYYIGVQEERRGYAYKWFRKGE